MVSILIAFMIVLAAHLTCDRDFPENVKNGAYAVFIILGVLYIVFGIF